MWDFYHTKTTRVASEKFLSGSWTIYGKEITNANIIRQENTDTDEYVYTIDHSGLSTSILKRNKKRVSKL